MKTTENNILIAEFMQFNLIDGKHYEIPQFGYIKTDGSWSDIFYPQTLKFHSNWNWLHEAVNLCSKLDYEIGNDKYFKPKLWMFVTNEIAPVYEAVINFITWYNQAKSNKFARKCSITGEGINAGFVIDDGEFYLKDDVQILDNWIKEKTEYADRNEAYNDDYYYYTEWEDESDFQYEMIDGVLTEIE